MEPVDPSKEQERISDEDEAFERAWLARRKGRGPLYRLPDLAAMRPALLLYLGFWLVSLYGWYYGDALDLGAEWAQVFVQHDYWRLLSSLFMHDDLSHILSNGWMFCAFGWFLRQAYGFVVFPLLSLAMGVVTMGLALWGHGPGVHVVGASGMIYAMVAFWLVSYLRYEIRYVFWVRLMRALAFVLIMLIPEELKAHTSYISHALGFMVGALTAFALWPFRLVASQEKNGLSQEE